MNEGGESRVAFLTLNYDDMTKHSKNNTASSVFSYAEKQKTGQLYRISVLEMTLIFPQSMVPKRCVQYFNIMIDQIPIGPATSRERIYAKI